MQRATLSLLFGLSGLLTGVGFLVEAVPFVMAWLPFAIALVVAPALAQPRLAVLVLMAGHFLWPTLISAWGLIQLGLHPLAVVAGGVAATLLVSAGIAWLGIGLSALILAALPVFPANPLLITGAILPGTGLWGLIALPFCVTLIEIQRGIGARAVVLVALLVLPRLFHSGFDSEQAVAHAPDYKEIDISDERALTELGYWAQIMAHIEDGDQLVLGENMFRHDDHGAIFWWCRTVQARKLTVLIGVEGPSGPGEVWQFDTASCPDPKPVYRAALAIPMINGGWWPRTTHFAQRPDTNGSSLEPHWLICFEAFSLWRWVDLGQDIAGQDSSRPVVILANDRWTAPFSTALLRRKVAAQFAALFGVEVFHADRERSALVYLKGRNSR